MIEEPSTLPAGLVVFVSHSQEHFYADRPHEYKIHTPIATLRNLFPLTID